MENCRGIYREETDQGARLLFGYRQLHGFSSYGMLLVEWSYSTSALIVLVKLKVSQVRLLKNIRC